MLLSAFILATIHLCQMAQNVYKIYDFYFCLTLSAEQTKINTLDSDETADNEPSHQDLHCLPFSFFYIRRKPLFATVDMSKFKNGRVKK